MQQAAGNVIGTHDFTSFAASDPDQRMREERETSDPIHGKSSLRTIFTSVWRRESELMIYRIAGSGFLHHMVRNLVGTFVDVGRGRIPADGLLGILAARSRAAAGPTAPPQGLFLIEVDYMPPAESR
jgi:tRNA pseudouridine38-40 synthase